MRKRYTRLPAKCIQPATVHQLARGSVGFAAVKVDHALVADGLAHGKCQLFDGDVATKADVDVALHRLGVGV